MRQSVLKEVRRAMDSFRIPPDAGRILTAVSGGADSVCLMLSLRELGYQVSAVHVEHGIRGEESLEDCAYVRRLCEERKIPLQVVSVDVPAVARERGMTLEEAAHCERHRILRETARSLGIRVIATAHHRMDQAETVLWNLIRGSSLGGLCGIRPLRQEEGLTLIRPMLGCERDRIEAFLTDLGVSWCTDRTNADVRITRNAIRLQVLPLLEKLNPGAAKHIAQAAGDLRETEDWLQERTKVCEADVMLHGGGTGQDLTADRAALKQVDGVIRRRILHRMIARCMGGAKDIARDHVLALERLVDAPNGKEICLPGGLRAVSEEGVLRLTCREDVQQREMPDVPLERDGVFYYPAEWFPEGMPGCYEPMSVPDLPAGSAGWFRAEVSFLTWEGGEVPKKKYTKHLAYDTMAPCVVLRTRKPGDYLLLHAASGRKKLKDYLIDEKVPRERRDSLLLAAQGSHVLWVAGMRISEGAKVRDGSQAVTVTVSAVPAEGRSHEGNRKSPDTGRPGG